MSHHEAEEDQCIKVPQEKKIIIRPRGLHIVWGRDSRYWQLPEKDSDGHAELKQVCWLEITGSADVDEGEYAIEFEVSMKQDAFGWSGCPVFMMAKVGKRGKYRWKKINTLDEKKGTTFRIPTENQKLEIYVAREGDKKLFFGLYEVWSGKWKGGLGIHRAIITKTN